MINITYSENIETSNLSSILGGLSLRVIEVGRNSDNSILDVHSKICFSSFLHFGQNHGTYLLWGEGLRLILVLDL